jgi:hypothetical protein
MKNDIHNHFTTLRESHFVHRNLALTKEVKQQIALQTLTKTVFQQIVINLRLNTNEKDSQLKMKNLYNYKQFVKSQALNNLIAIQFLMQKLSVRSN